MINRQSHTFSSNYGIIVHTIVKINFKINNHFPNWTQMCVNTYTNHNLHNVQDKYITVLLKVFKLKNNIFKGDNLCCICLYGSINDSIFIPRAYAKGIIINIFRKLTNFQDVGVIADSKC